MDDREKNLPKWAQELIASLRKRISTLMEGNDPYVKEIARQRGEIEKYKLKSEALLELLQCAAKGGHIKATEIVTVIESYAPWEEKS